MGHKPWNPPIRKLPTTRWHCQTFPRHLQHTMLRSLSCKPHYKNHDVLFLGHTHVAPGSVITDEGLEEYFIDRIIQAKCCGHGWWYLVCWVEYGQEEDCWLASKELADCEVLNMWLIKHVNDI